MLLHSGLWRGLGIFWKPVMDDAHVKQCLGVLLWSGQTQSCPVLWAAILERVCCGRVHLVLPSSPWGDCCLCPVGWVLPAQDGCSWLSTAQQQAGSFEDRERRVKCYCSSFKPA